MKFLSTRGKAPSAGFAEVLERGLASDGGLYVPERFPRIDPDRIARCRLNMVEVGKLLLSPFMQEADFAGAVEGICEGAFDFPVPLVPVSRDTAVLELFHGPTAAFKDFGARFLAECLSVLRPREPVSGKFAMTRTILVATSGDTGGAVAAAFHKKPGFEVIILFPKGRISPRQEKQLTCWGENIRSFAVRGTFDDCQRMVKEAFQDPRWRCRKNLTSANSINIGRILPQAVYYALASLSYLNETGEAPGFIIPSGNIGNSVAALWAKKMGFPIGQVVLACNANRAVADYSESGVWKPRETIATLANAMDVGNPSNMERVLNLYPHLEDFRKDVQVYSFDDDQIRKTIMNSRSHWGQTVCPHTATAVRARELLPGGNWIMVATAHPAKFETIVEPLIGRTVEVPATLSWLLSAPSRFTELEPTSLDVDL